jgi:RNA polymerase sigma-70 factor (ECF subfamily)
VPSEQATQTAAGPDQDVIHRAQQYEEDALGALFDMYYPKVYNYGLIQLREVQAAEDLASDVMLRVIESISRYQPRGVPFSAWVFRIARNRVVDIRRRSHRRREVALVDSLITTSGASSPHSTVEHTLDFGEVCLALGRLTKAQEQVIVLRFLKDLDVATVARTLGRSESAVKSIQFRALTALRRLVASDEMADSRAPLAQPANPAERVPAAATAV